MKLSFYFLIIILIKQIRSLMHYTPALLNRLKGQRFNVHSHKHVFLRPLRTALVNPKRPPAAGPLLRQSVAMRQRRTSRMVQPWETLALHSASGPCTPVWQHAVHPPRHTAADVDAVALSMMSAVADGTVPLGPTGASSKERLDHSVMFSVHLQSNISSPTTPDSTQLQLYKHAVFSN